MLGNPQGKVTLVEFTDYACGYCRQSVADVRALLADHPDLRIVVRELPILSPASGDAARMALTAASQGKYAAFHDAMFAGSRPDAASIAAAASAAGVVPKATTGAARDELANNLDLARKLGINGTPAWVVGDRLLVGAVGREALEQAIVEAAREHEGSGRVRNRSGAGFRAGPRVRAGAGGALRRPRRRPRSSNSRRSMPAC